MVRSWAQTNRGTQWVIDAGIDQDIAVTRNPTETIADIIFARPELEALHTVIQEKLEVADKIELISKMQSLDSKTYAFLPSNKAFTPAIVERLKALDSKTLLEAISHHFVSMTQATGAPAPPCLQTEVSFTTWAHTPVNIAFENARYMIDGESFDAPQYKV